MKDYAITDQTIRINHIDYLIRTLKDRQQFSNVSKAAEKLGINDSTWSLFGVVWPASRILATTVSLLQLEGKRILEIGCGIALSSIVLHKMGFNITASDYHPLAKQFLTHNIKHNQLPPIKYQTGNWETENQDLDKFDLIIGSDVLYQPSHVNDVSQFINRHASDTAEIIIVDPDRGNRSKFSQKMNSLGYEHHSERFNVAGDTDTRCKGQVIHYQKPVTPECTGKRV